MSGYIRPVIVEERKNHTYISSFSSSSSIPKFEDCHRAPAKRIRCSSHRRPSGAAERSSGYGAFQRAHGALGATGLKLDQRCLRCVMLDRRHAANNRICIRAQPIRHACTRLTGAFEDGHDSCRDFENPGVVKFQCDLSK
jgi:hypothetical protein